MNVNNDDAAMAGAEFSTDDVTNTNNNIDIDDAVVVDVDDDDGIDFDDAVIDFALLDNVQRNRICQKVVSILQQKEDFPSQQQETVVQFAQQFLKIVKRAVKDMITNQRTEGEGYPYPTLQAQSGEVLKFKYVKPQNFKYGTTVECARKLTHS